MKLLVPLVLGLTGVGAGVGAGVLLRPEPAAAISEHEAASDAPAGSPAEAGAHTAAAQAGSASAEGSEFVDLRNQFIIPVLEKAAVNSFVVLDLDLQVAMGTSEAVNRMEPKIRDAFLTVLFDHANAGGFDGAFTSSGAMDALRAALREAGQKVAGRDVLTDVLIASVVRQDT